MGQRGRTRDWAKQRRGSRLWMWFTVPGNGQDSALDKDPDLPEGTEGYLGAFPPPCQAGRTEAF